MKVQQLWLIVAALFLYIVISSLQKSPNTNVVINVNVNVIVYAATITLVEPEAEITPLYLWTFKTPTSPLRVAIISDNGTAVRAFTRREPEGVQEPLNESKDTNKPLLTRIKASKPPEKRPLLKPPDEQLADIQEPMFEINKTINIRDYLFSMLYSM